GGGAGVPPTAAVPVPAAGGEPVRVAATPVTTIQPAIRRESILPKDIDEPEPRRSIVKPLIVLLIIAILAAAAVVGSIGGLRWSPFLGVDPATRPGAGYHRVPVELTPHPT